MSKRFYLSPEDIQGGEAMLHGEEAHHVVHVMRMKVGERLILFDGEGREYQGVIREILKKEVAVSLHASAEEDPKRVSITVACALPRHSRIEQVIEKLTEIGVAAILPLSTERTILKIEGDREEKKLARWRRIATEAAKQSGAMRLPEISKVCSFSEVLGCSSEYDLAILLCPEGSPLRECLGAKKINKVILLVGPEGGWSERELEAATKRGWKSVSLGKNILKVDTACLVAASILHYVLDSSSRRKGGNRDLQTIHSNKSRHRGETQFPPLERERFV